MRDPYPHESFRRLVSSTPLRGSLAGCERARSDLIQEKPEAAPDAGKAGIRAKSVGIMPNGIFRGMTPVFDGRKGRPTEEPQDDFDGCLKGTSRLPGPHGVLCQGQRHPEQVPHLAHPCPFQGRCLTRTVTESEFRLSHGNAEELLQQVELGHLDGRDQGHVLRVARQVREPSPKTDAVDGPEEGWASSSSVRPRLVTL